MKYKFAPYEKEYIQMVQNHRQYYDMIHGHPVHYIQAQCSTAHTYGNVIAFIQNWLLNLFPENTFKTIHVNSKIAHTQLRSVPGEFLKKAYPMFILRPRIDWNDTNRFLNGTLVTERQGDLYSTYGNTNLEPFIQDNHNKVAVKYQLRREVINIDVVMFFQTSIQQTNWAGYIQNATRSLNTPQFLPTHLDSYISPELLKVLSDLAHIPMMDENGSTADFLKYLNSVSMFPITYKLQGSSGTEEFFRHYPVNIDTKITDFNVDEGETVGQVKDRYQVTMTLRCEFWGTGFYYLFSDEIAHHTTIKVDFDDDSNFIPIFTDVLTKDDIDLPMGWHVFAQPICRLEHGDKKICIDEVLNNSIREAIKFHTARGIPINQFLKIRVRKQGKLMDEDVEYRFLPDTREIVFIHASTYYTYKIIIMLNVQYINELVKDIYHIK